MFKKKKRSHLPSECDFVNSTVKYYLPSLGGTEREESYSFGNSDKIQKCMQLPHLFREHFRTYNILDSILNSGEMKINKHSPCPQRILQPYVEISTPGGEYTMQYIDDVI